MTDKINQFITKNKIFSCLQLAIIHFFVVYLSSIDHALAEEKTCQIIDVELIGSYTGECNSEGFADGKGAAKGTATYVGEFKNGKKHGHGIKVWKSGSRYIGEFVEDQREGYGIYEWQEVVWQGERFIGQYKNDKRHGKGIYEWPTGERYSGEWSNDQMIGEPTTMMLLRGKHHLAADKAINVGTKVCRENSIGVGYKEWVSGIVESKNQLEIKIKIIDSGSALADAQGKFISPDEVVTDNILLWMPCY